MRRAICLVAGLGLATACSPSVDLPDGGFSVLPDRQIDPPPAAPSVDPVPPVTPYQLVTFRGISDGRRVFVTANGLNPEAVTVGSGGAFCVDVRFTNPGSYLFGLQAYGQDGQIGDPLPQPIMVTYDPSAPEVDNLLTCGGVHPRGCTDQIEICDNQIDDNCNNLVDEQDPQCNPCIDDLFEDNDRANAASIQPGQYGELQICPEDPDYYGIFVRKDERLSAQIFFTHAEGNLDLDLLSVATNPADLEDRTVLTRSATLDDNEVISYTATVTGVHMLRVFGNMNTANEYRLVVSLSDN